MHFKNTNFPFEGVGTIGPNPKDLLGNKLPATRFELVTIRV